MEGLPSRSRPDRLYGLKPPALRMVSVVRTLHVHDMRPIPPDTMAMGPTQNDRQAVRRCESCLDDPARPRETQRPFRPGARGHSLSAAAFPALLDPESTARLCGSAGERRQPCDDVAAAAV